MCDEDDCSISRFCYALSFCCCFLGASFLIAIFCIGFISSAKIESGSIYIGDVLGDSSGLLKVSSPAVATAKFETHYGIEIFETNQFPTIVTDKLPLQHFNVSSDWLVDTVVTRDSLNYLGSYDPIYLLSGSSIQYNVTIKCTKRINSQYAACLYLFDDYASFDDFINSNLNGHPETASHCFESKATATLSYSFNITTNGLYYVGIAFLGSVNIQASASVVRQYYNTSELELIQVCSSSHTCVITVCNIFLCIDQSTTYFLIQPANITKVNYTFSSPRLHGPILASFCGTVLVGSFFCSCCVVIFFCMALFFPCDVDCEDVFCDCLFKRTEPAHIVRYELQPRPAATTVSHSETQPLSVPRPTPSRQIQQDDNNNNNDNNEDCSRTSHESRQNIDRFDEDLSLALYLSSQVETNSNQNEQSNSNSFVSLIEEDEENWDDFSEHLPTESDSIPLIDFSDDGPLNEGANPPNYWDIISHSANLAEVPAMQQNMTEQCASATNNEDNNLITVHVTSPLAVIPHINQADRVQPVSFDDILLPLPSFILSLPLPLEVKTINEERKELSSDNDASHTESSSVGPLTLYKPLPSDFKAKLDESHAPAILSAIKGIVDEWDIVGIFLGIDNANIERIKSNNSNVDHRRKEIIIAWLRYGNATRQHLIEALKEVTRPDIARKLEEL
ncbi:PREDICTED: uncharacterized protein LOC109588402 isoform X2 [Amphimedon queenslandica]|uniref:Death domain-containing protein n=1 Tax=Amphimedon queenslandica TaxID=400682 RepID=A0AAN0JTH3_AMPQE|nr:PREDICTED: uncharacterized protein LOC109588402 isoform X2 [Amphimedon queenslandica]|eukprot:XP_019860133.1 PREDICTED: uncharacterized protein LOC109588402 isoform X2 [Amphimedon queenslandica]